MPASTEGASATPTANPLFCDVAVDALRRPHRGSAATVSAFAPMTVATDTTVELLAVTLTDPDNVHAADAVADPDNGAITADCGVPVYPAART